MKKIVGACLLMQVWTGITQIHGQSFIARNIVNDRDSIAAAESNRPSGQKYMADIPSDSVSHDLLHRSTIRLIDEPEPKSKPASVSPYTIHPIRELGFLTSSVVLAGTAQVGS